jgi:hypothetical protein
MDESLDKNENQQEQQQLEKPKKPRTDAQLKATERMLLAKKVKQDEMNELKILRQEKEKQDQDKIKQKLEDKILKKAINLKKKTPMTKKDILKLLPEAPDDDSIEEIQPVKTRVKPTPATSEPTPPPTIPTPNPIPTILFLPKRK